jgi:hypothetical protein
VCGTVLRPFQNHCLLLVLCFQDEDSLNEFLRLAVFMAHIRSWAGFHGQSLPDQSRLNKRANCLICGKLDFPSALSDHCTIPYPPA